MSRASGENLLPMKDKTDTENSYDVIVIGSGIGGLTVAALAAKFSKKKVLVLERNFKAGGYTHTFKRKQKWHWDVGVHYLGDITPGSLNYKLFDIVSNNKVHWNKLPYEFDKFVYPNRIFGVPSDKREYEKKLIDNFPEEAKNIKQYFKDVKSAANFGFYFFGGLYAPAPARWFLKMFTGIGGKDFRNITTLEYMKNQFQNPELRGLLLSQWGDYGLPPSRSSFFLHCMVVNHYLDGAWYPEGGSQIFAEGTEEILLNNDGQLLVNSQVTEILVKDKKVTGVRYVPTQGPQKDTEIEIHAEIVVSDAGSYNTYCRLLPAEYAPGYKEGIESFLKKHQHTTSISLFLGFKDTPAKLGFQGENHWVYSGYDHDLNYEKRNEINGEEISLAYFSFASLKDSPGKPHTGEIITFMDYEIFAEWKSQPWKKRDAKYQAFKNAITEKLLTLAEKLYPGFRDLVEFSELATPLTNESFTGHFQGVIYGMPGVPERFDLEKSPWCNVLTPVKNLYLTGADACATGVAGAMSGGLFAAMQILNPMQILRIL